MVRQTLYSIKLCVIIQGCPTMKWTICVVVSILSMEVAKQRPKDQQTGKLWRRFLCKSEL